MRVKGRFRVHLTLATRPCGRCAAREHRWRRAHTIGTGIRTVDVDQSECRRVSRWIKSRHLYLVCTCAVVRILSSVRQYLNGGASMLRIYPTIAVLGMSFLISPSASAACVQANSAGVWRYFAQSGYSSGSSTQGHHSEAGHNHGSHRAVLHDSHWRGHFSINSVGVMTGGSGTEQYPTAGMTIGTRTVPVSLARLTVQASCRAFGYFVSGGVRYDFEGWMSRDKEEIQGVGRFVVPDGTLAIANGQPDDAGTFTLHMVRQ